MKKPTRKHTTDDIVRLRNILIQLCPVPYKVSVSTDESVDLGTLHGHVEGEFFTLQFKYIDCWVFDMHVYEYRLYDPEDIADLLDVISRAYAARRLIRDCLPVGVLAGDPPI